MSAHYGFIGLGNMGAPMAERLIDAGNTLTIFDIRAEAMAPLLAKGATVAASPAAVASAAETVFASLPTPEVVRAVALGTDGVASGNRVSTFVDLSTTGATVAKEIAAGLAAQEIVAIDAPVSGGVNGAKAGTLSIMLAGPRALCDALAPALSVIGKVFWMGAAPGLGQTMKLCNNMLAAANFAITSEALCMGVKAGLDAAQMIDVINAASGKNSATQGAFPRAVLDRSFNLGFATGLMHKDVRLFLDEANAQGVPVWVNAAVAQMWRLAASELGNDSDFSRLVTCVEEWAGVEVKR